jgi:hypothetical protein
MKSFLGVFAAISCLAIGCAAFAQENAGGNALVVAVGIGECQGMAKIPTACGDARAVAEVFGKSTGAKAEGIALLVDDAADPEGKPTLENIQKRITEIATLATDKDTLVIFIAGHGTVRDERGFIVSMEGQGAPLALDWIGDAVAESNAKAKVLILDGCYSEESAAGLAKVIPGVAAMADNFTVLLASAPGQVSRADDAGKQGVFTGFLTRGLGGEADADSDTRVTLSEAFEYVRMRMKRWEGETGVTQRPVLVGIADSSVEMTRVKGKPSHDGKAIVIKATLNVKAVDAESGKDLNGLEVYMDGKMVGVTPLAGIEVAEGTNVRVEVSGENLTSYSQGIFISRVGAHNVIAGLASTATRTLATPKAALSPRMPSRPTVTTRRRPNQPRQPAGTPPGMRYDPLYGYVPINGPQPMGVH